jgi:hypothetical protein
MRPEGNFSVGLSNALLEPKHYRAMGDALWLYTYLLDRQTRRLDKNGSGQVAGGVPIRDPDIAGTIGSSGRTISRWRTRLKLHGYITTRRTPYGYCYAITKPKKWMKSAERDQTHPAHLSDGNNWRDRTQTVKRSDTTCINKEEVQRETVVAATAIPAKQMADEVNAAWDHYLDVFHKEEEIISPPARQKGLAILTALREKHPTITSEQRIDGMCAAIDQARSIVKKQPAKNYFSDWFSIFGKFQTFYSLWEEAN